MTTGPIELSARTIYLGSTPSQFALVTKRLFAATVNKRQRDQIEEIIELLRHSSGQTLFFHNAVAQQLGLGPYDHKCLDLLLRKGPMTPGELSRNTGLSTGAITGIVDRLSGSGYVRREPDAEDRRRVRIIPVWSSISVDIGPLFQPLGDALKTMLAQWNEEELACVERFLTHCSDAYEQATVVVRDLEPPSH